MLINPGIVAGFGAVLTDALEAWTGILVKRPALGAMISRGGWTVQRTLALAPVEAADVTTSQRHPNHALFVDVATAWGKARCGHMIDLGQRRLGRIGARCKPQHRTATGEDADRVPDRAINGARHHRVRA